MSDPRKVLGGVKRGDRRVRVDRPHAKYFRYQAPGVLTTKLATDEPTTPLGHALARVRRVLFGRPLSNEEELVERLPKWKAKSDPGRSASRIAPRIARAAGRPAAMAPTLMTRQKKSWVSSGSGSLPSE